MKDNRYYTAGELAGLFDIPKQTMFYYDRMGILEPEFIAENGYRYYSTTQYLTLEIILFLRKMDISVPDIRDFLKDRSKENLHSFLTERRNVCGSWTNVSTFFMHWILMSILWKPVRILY